MSALEQLVNNAAFWSFLAAVSVAYIGYKTALVPYLEDRKRKKYASGDYETTTPNLNIKTVSSFDELKAVVEILQNELQRKDKVMREQDQRHRDELLVAYRRIDELYSEVDKLKKQISDSIIRKNDG